MQNETLNKEIKVGSEITTIDLRMHTIVLLIGPSGCGKTYFTENKLIPSLTKHDGVRVAHLSSDNIRRELVGDMNLSKQDPRMMHASKQAFNLLNAKLDALTSYPINNEFVVVDSTGLSEDFREDIKKIANDNNYNLVVILFDYKGRKPYTDFITDEESLAVTSRQIDYLRKEVMSKLGKKNFRDVFKIKSHDLSEYEVNLVNHDLYQECLLSNKFDYVTIGDIHGCYDEFVALLEKNDFKVEGGKISHEDSDKRIVLVGDLVDKGYAVGPVIELIHNNLDLFFMTKGNHENFVYRYLKNDIPTKDLPEQEVIDTYFDSITLFESDEDLKQKFFEVVDAMKPFLLHDDFVVTHAPCDQKYLGKLGSVSERNQRTIVYPKEAEFENKLDYLEAKYNFFKFFRSQASRSLPYHLFGHVSTKGIGRLYNKINLDTGAVSGGKLTSIIINKNGRHLLKDVSSRENEKVVKKDLNEFFYKPPMKVSLETLEGREKKRIVKTVENKVNFISGTICPADKEMLKDENKVVVLDRSELESLDQGISYFLRRKVTEVVAQPKYMGSRANIYLFKDPSKNYTVSRGGYVITSEQVDLTESYKPLYDMPFIKEAFKGNTELLILDAELLPWSAIGRGLIDRQFVTVDKAITSELDFLKNTGFENQFNKVWDGPYTDCDFETIQHRTSKTDLVNMIGSNQASTFKCMRDYRREFPSVHDLGDLAEVYTKQIELYGSDGAPHFKAFSILKQVFEDGTEKLFFDENNDEIYKGINTDECLVIDLTKEEDIQKLRDFYNKTTVDEQMEGIMLKPRTVYVKEVAPALKVRNPRYLTIVYGPDYMTESKLSKLISRKNIRGKLEVSIKEWEVGKRMLEIPYKDINQENKHFIQACGEMILEERKERELDPRL